MIRVCDAIMGTGKSSAAISYMNEHSDEKFIYITPYLSEAKRIKDGCPDLKFVEPSNKLSEHNFKKMNHTAALIKEGKNITTTHQAFRKYPEDMLVDIREKEYTLIIDENLEMLNKYDIHSNDMQILVDAGYVKEENGEYSITDKEYNGEMFKTLFEFLSVRNFIRIDSSDKESLFYWTLPPELITSFKEVFVLTYLFDGQSIKYFFQINNLEYEYVGIERTAGGYKFGPAPGYTPEYVSHIEDVLHIYDGENLNSIGDGYFALSKNWLNKREEVEMLRRRVDNYFRNIHKDKAANDKMWGTFKDAYNTLCGKGYTKSFVTFNARSTNEYKDRVCLAYLTNIFMNVGEKMFYQSHGIEVDEDLYALSIMIQWIWRSAIRDGQEVFLYIPSRRMRNLLINWINDLKKGADTDEEM